MSTSNTSWVCMRCLSENTAEKTHCEKCGTKRRSSLSLDSDPGNLSGSFDRSKLGTEPPLGPSGGRPNVTAPSSGTPLFQKVDTSKHSTSSSADPNQAPSITLQDLTMTLTKLTIDDSPWLCPCCTVENEGKCLLCGGCGFRKSDCKNAQKVQAGKDALRSTAKGVEELQKTLTPATYTRLKTEMAKPPPTVLRTQKQNSSEEAFDLPNGVLETVTKHYFLLGPPQQWKKHEAQVKIDLTTFAKGVERVAIRMLDTSRAAGKRACIGKYYIKGHYKSTEELKRSYFAGIEMQVYCQAIAREYNIREPPKEVMFIDAWLVERHGSHVEPHMKYIAAEPYLGSEPFVKYNSNFGFVNEANRNTPAAFSHFSYDFTGGRLLIVDLQGIEDRYTDPQIHSTGGIGFGSGDMGDNGMNVFFTNHRCNTVCEYLQLQLHPCQLKENSMIPAQPTESSDTFFEESESLPLVGSISSNVVDAMSLSGSHVPTVAVSTTVVPAGKKLPKAVAFDVGKFVAEIRPEPVTMMTRELTLLCMAVDEFNDLVAFF